MISKCLQALFALPLLPHAHYSLHEDPLPILVNIRDTPNLRCCTVLSISISLSLPPTFPPSPSPCLKCSPILASIFSWFNPWSLSRVAQNSQCGPLYQTSQSAVLSYMVFAKTTQITHLSHFLFNVCFPIIAYPLGAESLFIEVCLEPCHVHKKCSINIC